MTRRTTRAMAGERVETAMSRWRRDARSEVRRGATRERTATDGENAARAARASENRENVVPLREGAVTRYAGPAMLAGTYAMFSFEVTCEPMDLEISFRKGADESRNDARRSDGDAAAAAYADEDDEARFILHRGALEHPEMLGVYANDSLSFGLFPHEDSVEQRTSTRSTSAFGTCKSS